ncbi:SCO family protein [bacterium]|nr:SCO family protein [bacterium]
MNLASLATWWFALIIILISPALHAQNAIPPILQSVDIEQKLNAQIPVDAEFKDENGKSVRLSDLLKGKPAILTLVYYECPMLCTQVLNGLVSSLRPLTFTPGNEFNIITISFDPTETSELARSKKLAYLKEYERTDVSRGWYFLTGDAKSIERVTQAAGFRYMYDQKIDQYAHGSGIMVLTPQGKVARYFYGIEYSTRDLRFALIEASQNRIGSIADKVLLYCFHYDPSVGKYSAYAINLIRLGGIVTVLLLGGFILKMRRKDSVNHVR